MASDKKKSNPEPEAKVSVREVSKEESLTRRTFPGPRDTRTDLRVAVERSAYGELIAHAKSSLDAEVCGIMAGTMCEDDEGPFVHVEAIIRGTSANQGSTHVTFTQATWTSIHQSLERDHPKLKMVGWYHTHPGFGVEFSDMDLFIQKNFFPGQNQVALVTDPLNGAVAICYNTPKGQEYLPRFWVDGREQLCKCPEPAAGPAPAGGPIAPTDANLLKSIQSLEARVSQMVQVIDDQQRSYHTFLLTVGMVACVAIIASVGFSIYNQLTSRLEPPKVIQNIPVPIQVGDKTVIVGVGLTEWNVPPELDALYQKEAKLRIAEEKKAAAAKAKESAATNSAPPDPAAGNADKPTTKP